MQKIVYVILLFIYLHTNATGQPTKSVTPYGHFWTSVNSAFQFNERWGMLADAHVRRQGLDPSFYFGRIGVIRYFNNQTSAALGYGNLVSPSAVIPDTWNLEHRIYQQFQYGNKAGSVNMLQRVRNEQRWKNIAKNANNPFFTNRIRYLLSLTIPVFQKPTLPSLVVADEILMQWGKTVVFNPFDQNRLFVGIHQPLSKNWSYDAGYMYVFQQREIAYQYNAFHTFRLFFYYSFSKNPKINTPLSGDE